MPLIFSGGGDIRGSRHTCADACVSATASRITASDGRGVPATRRQKAPPPDESQSRANWSFVERQSGDRRAPLRTTLQKRRYKFIRLKSNCRARFLLPLYILALRV